MALIFFDASILVLSNEKIKKKKNKSCVDYSIVILLTFKSFLYTYKSKRAFYFTLGSDPLQKE